MPQNMQAVKMRFKPLCNSSYDTDIIFELASGLKAIVGGNKGVYKPLQRSKGQTLRELAKNAYFEACSRHTLPISERRSNKRKPY